MRDDSDLSDGPTNLVWTDGLDGFAGTDKSLAAAAAWVLRPSLDCVFDRVVFLLRCVVQV